MQRILSTWVLSAITICLFAQGTSTTIFLDNYLKDQASDLGLTESDLSYRVSSHYASTHTGVEHVYLKQYYRGIPVRAAILNANISPTGEVLSIGNRFVRNLVAKADWPLDKINAREALAVVLPYFGPRMNGERIRPAEVQNIEILQQDAQRVTFAASGISLEPIEAKLEWLPYGEELFLIWTVEYHTLDGQHVWQVSIDATEGELLEYRDLVVHCQWSCEEDESGNEVGPSVCTSAGRDHHHQADAHQLLADGTPNSYHVFPYPVESPNHGVPEVVVDPADALASPFGWHDTNGVAGAEFTITRGNNVHAYHDIFQTGLSVGDEPDGGTELCFDFPYVDSLRPHQQIDAAITNLFFWNNLTHDFLYQYGFDEAAGNFQANNYSDVPDSLANDWVLAQGIDGGGIGNANFFTRPDGQLSRMQMYVWESTFPESHQFILSVTEPDSLVGTYGYRPARFGPLLLADEDGPLTLEVVEVIDTVNTENDACDSLLNPEALAGNAALITRSGGCSQITSALNAQEAGAVLAIICSNSGDQLFSPSSILSDNDLEIPAIGLSRVFCDSLLAGMPGLTIQLPTDIQLPNPGPPGLDSDYDNLVIVHEYVHGLSQRLTGGPLETGCLIGLEQAGEGWSDFFGLVLTTDATNTADEPRGIGTYLTNEPVDGRGIRPFPFSRNMGINPITYADINSVPFPHGTGSIFCSALWDLYWNLTDEYGFDSDIYNGTGGNNLAVQLVVDGMKLQPCRPNFAESRDAILLADSILTGGENACTIWETFARRGIGVGVDTIGDMASFISPYTCRPFVQIEKSIEVSEELAGQELEYLLDIRNGRLETVNDVVVYDTLPFATSLVPGSSNCNVTESDGVLAFALGDMPGAAIVECSYRITTDPDLFSVLDFEDDTRNFSDWDRESSVSDVIWGFRNGFDFSGNRAFFANNVDSITDFSLTMEDAYQLSDDRPGVILDHFYRTDEGSDGGVIEISLDDGENWVDVGPDNIIENGYQLTPLANSGNPLAGRRAFTGRLDTFQRTVIDLSDYAGQSAKLRFRFASDESGGGEGWIIDHIDYYENIYVAVNEAVVTTDSITQRSTVGVLIFPNPNSTNEVEGDLDLSIYPNPTGGLVWLQAGNEFTGSALDLRLTDLNGRTILRKTIDRFNGRESISLTNLPKGVYLLEARSDQGFRRIRLLKQ